VTVAGALFAQAHPLAILFNCDRAEMYRACIARNTTLLRSAEHRVGANVQSRERQRIGCGLAPTRRRLRVRTGNDAAAWTFTPTRKDATKWPIL
jgi:hypothetical protein